MVMDINGSELNKPVVITITDKETGKPIRGVDVDIYLNGKGVWNLKTDKDGKTQFVPTQAGDYRIKSDRSGYHDEWETIGSLSAPAFTTTSTTTTSTTTTVKTTTTTTVISTIKTTTSSIGIITTTTPSTTATTTTTSKPGETCSDGIRNQGEEGIDCGGPCAPCPGFNWLWLVPLMVLGILVFLLVRGRKKGGDSLGTVMP